MKDIFGKEIEVGDYVVYIISADSKHLEKAIVTDSEETFIKIEYLGICSSNFLHLSCYTKDQGQKSRLTVTEKKILVINSEDNEEKDIYKEGREKFKTQLTNIQQSLTQALKREDDLKVKNRLLQVEVNKINNRFEILDL